MPSIPEPAIQAAAEVLLRQYESEYSAAHLSWRDFLDPARAVLDAAAPLLAQHIAEAISAHAAGHLAGDNAYQARARRRLGIAARIAAGAFGTGEDQKRLAAEAISRGDHAASNIQEVPDA